MYVTWDSVVIENGVKRAGFDDLGKCLLQILQLNIEQKIQHLKYSTLKCGNKISISSIIHKNVEIKYIVKCIDA